MSENLTLRLTADASGFISGIKAAEREVRGIPAAAGDAAQQTGQALSSLSGSVRGVGGAAHAAQQDVEHLAAAARSASQATAAAFGGASPNQRTLSDQIGRSTAALQQQHAELGKIGPAAQAGEQGISGLATGLGNLKGMLIGIGVVKFASDILTTTSAAQQLEARLAGLVGAGAAVADTRRFLGESAKKLSVDEYALTDSYTKFLVLQKEGLLTTDQARGMLIGFANVQKATGASTEQLKSSLYGLSQGLSAGVLRAEDANQVFEPLPGLLQKMDRAAGQAEGGFRRMVVAGQVTSTMLRETLIKALKEYDGAAERSSGTIEAAHARWTNSWRRFQEEAGKRFAPGVNRVLDMGTSVVDAVTDHGGGALDALALSQAEAEIVRLNIEQDVLLRRQDELRSLVAQHDAGKYILGGSRLSAYQAANAKDILENKAEMQKNKAEMQRAISERIAARAAINPAKPVNASTVFEFGWGDARDASGDQINALKNAADAAGLYIERGKLLTDNQQKLRAQLKAVNDVLLLTPPGVRDAAGSLDNLAVIADRLREALDPVTAAIREMGRETAALAAAPGLDRTLVQTRQAILKSDPFAFRGDPSGIAASYIRGFEGFSGDAYQRRGDVPTIGYGTTEAASGAPVALGDSITRDQAEILLQRDVERAADVVARHVNAQILERVTAQQRAALISFVHNLGEGNFLKSDLLKAVNLGDFEGAGNLFSQYNRASNGSGQKVVLPGLTQRRATESALWRGAAPDRGADVDTAVRERAAAQVNDEARALEVSAAKQRLLAAAEAHSTDVTRARTDAVRAGVVYDKILASQGESAAKAFLDATLAGKGWEEALKGATPAVRRAAEAQIAYDDALRTGDITKYTAEQALLTEAERRQAAAAGQGEAATRQAAAAVRIAAEAHGDAARASILAGQESAREAAARTAAWNEFAGETDRKIAANQNVANAWNRGSVAAHEAEIAEKAHALALQEVTAQSKEYVAVYGQYLGKLKEERNSEIAAKLAEENAGRRDGIAIAQAELSLVGATDERRAVTLARLKAINELKAQGVDLEKLSGKAAEEAAAKISLAEQSALTDVAMRKAEASASEVQGIYVHTAQGIEESLTEAFTSALDAGGAKSFDVAAAFRKVWLQTAKEIAAALVFRPAIAQGMSALGLDSAAARYAPGYGSGGGGGGGGSGAGGNGAGGGLSLPGGGSGFGGTIDRLGYDWLGIGQQVAMAAPSADFVGPMPATISGGISQYVPAAASAFQAAQGFASGNYAQAGIQTAATVASIAFPEAAPFIQIGASLLGGLFGDDGKRGDPRGGADVRFAGGRLALGSVGGDNTYDPSKDSQAANQLIKQLNAFADGFGLTIDGNKANLSNFTIGSDYSNGTASFSRTSAEEVIQELLSRGVFTGEGNVGKAAQNYRGDFAGLQDALNFAKSLDDAKDKLEALLHPQQAALAALEKERAAVMARAGALGLEASAEEELYREQIKRAEEANALAKKLAEWGLQSLEAQISDNRVLLAAIQFDADSAQKLAQARYDGVTDTIRLERDLAELRKKTLSEAIDSLLAPLSSYQDQSLASGSSLLPEAQRIEALQAALAMALPGARSGSAEAIAKVAQMATSLRQAALQDYGAGPQREGLITMIDGTVTSLMGQLRTSLGGYATGGISYGPQMAWVSEGAYAAEAHVPLVDGHTIPVTLSAAPPPQVAQSGDMRLLEEIRALRADLGALRAENGRGLGMVATSGTAGAARIEQAVLSVTSEIREYRYQRRIGK